MFIYTHLHTHIQKHLQNVHVRVTIDKEKLRCSDNLNQQTDRSVHNIRKRELFGQQLQHSTDPHKQLVSVENDSSRHFCDYSTLFQTDQNYFRYDGVN